MNPVGNPSETLLSFFKSSFASHGTYPFKMLRVQLLIKYCLGPYESHADVSQRPISKVHLLKSLSKPCLSKAGPRERCGHKEWQDSTWGCVTWLGDALGGLTTVSLRSFMEELEATIFPGPQHS